MNDPIRGYCWHCGQALRDVDYGRETNCLGCHKPTHVCRNCRHFARGRPNDCLEPMAEPVLDKERANFCDLFEPDDKPTASRRGPAAADLVKAAEDLFK
jgi:hypothetical protein